jgi:transposase
MNRINDSEALDTFRQTVARIVRRLLEEGEDQQQQQQKEGKPCHSNA